MLVTAEVLASVVGTFLLALTTGYGFMLTRLGRLERKVELLEDENRVLWLWAQRLFAYALRYRRDDAPEVPLHPQEGDNE